MMKTAKPWKLIVALILVSCAATQFSLGEWQPALATLGMLNVLWL